MATTLAAAIAYDADPIAIAGDPLDPGAAGVLVDAEQMRIVRGADSPLFVQRAWNGTARAAHDSGATVTPLYLTLSATPGGA